MALSYIGGKSRIGTWIRNYIPNDIETFVEPFSGMFWVFFRLELSNYPNLKTNLSFLVCFILLLHEFVIVVVDKFNFLEASVMDINSFSLFILLSY